MKIKLYMDLYLSYLLITLFMFITIPNGVFIVLHLGFYYLLLNEYNRIGFINRKIFILSLLYILLLFICFGFFNYYLYMGIVLYGIIMKFYLPHRIKVKRLLKYTSFNREVKIYNNHLEIDDVIVNLEFTLREIEMMWLSKQIILRSNRCVKQEIKYINNEFLGNHFYVKIS